MTAREKISVTLAAAIVSLAAYSILRDLRAVRASEHQLALDESQLVTLTRQRKDLDRQLMVLQQETRQQEMKRLEAAPSTPLSEQNRESAARARPYLSDPDYQRFAQITSSAKRHLEFQRFYRMKGLRPEQIEEFEAIMARQDRANLEAAIARDTGGDERAIFKRSGPEWSAAMEQLLGSDGKRELQDYLRSKPIRSFLDSLAALTYPIGEPVQTEQLAQLERIVLAHDSTYQQGRGTDPGKVNWEAVWEPASRVLSSQQLTALQMMVEERSLKAEVQKGLNAAAPPKK